MKGLIVLIIVFGVAALSVYLEGSDSKLAQAMRKILRGIGSIIGVLLFLAIAGVLLIVAIAIVATFGIIKTLIVLAFLILCLFVFSFCSYCEKKFWNIRQELNDLRREIKGLGRRLNK